MDNNQTQPLRIDGGTFEVKGEGLTDEQIEDLRLQAEQEQAQKVEDARKAWGQLIGIFKPQQIQPQPKPEHIHGPFTFLLNPNHNALRGCTVCGQTWIGLMAGTEDSLQWHPVQEPVQAEE